MQANCANASPLYEIPFYGISSEPRSSIWCWELKQQVRRSSLYVAAFRSSGNTYVVGANHFKKSFIHLATIPMYPVSPLPVYTWRRAPWLNVLSLQNCIFRLWIYSTWINSWISSTQLYWIRTNNIYKLRECRDNI